MKNIRKYGLKTNKQKLVVGLSLYIILAIIFIISLFNSIEQYLKNRNQAKVKIMATSIDIETFSKLEGNKADVFKNEYHEIKNLLRRFKNTSENYKFVYLIGKNDDNSIFFYVDSEIIGSSYESLPGDIYKDAPKEAYESFSKNAGLSSNKYLDHWGNWITTYYPLHDANNKAIALLAVDFDANEWNELIGNFLILPIILIAILFTFFIFYHFYKIDKSKLIEKETQLQTVLTSDSLYIIKVDLNGNYTYVNQSFQKRYGWLNNNKSLIGINSLITILPDDHKKIMDITQLCIDNPGVSYQVSLKKPDEISQYRTNLWELTYIKNDETDTNEILGIGKDISNVDELEKELIFERDLFSSGPVVTLIWNNDDERTVRYVSKNVTNVLGYSSEEFINSAYSNFLHPLDKERIFSEVKERIICKSNNFEQSYRIRKKDGSYIWIFDLTKIYRNEKGEITEIRGYIFDQTKSKEYEEKLKNQNILLEGIIKGTNAGTWDWNIESGVLTINDRWAELLGYNIKELQPITIDTWAKSLHPQDLVIAQQELQKHFSGAKDYYDVIFRQLHKNGNYIWINSRGKVIAYNEKGEPTRIQGIHIDLTTHIEVLQKLKENENLLRSFISNINGIAFLVDKEGIFRLSEGLGLNGLNLKPKDVIGKSIYDVYKGETDLISQIEETLNGKSGIKIIKLNNKYFETNFSPIRNEEGLITSAIGISIDITEKFKTEENLKKLNIAIEQSPVSIFITDPQGKIEYANSEFSRTSGYSKREYLGKNPRILSSGLNDRKLFENLWKTIAKGKIWQGEVLNKTKNDDLIWESEIIAPIVDGNNNITNYICIKENITEKKKLIDELIKAKNQIEESDKLKTAFLQNMSHEIRTPLNGIIGFSRLLETEDLSKEEISEFVGLIKGSSNRLLETINNILELSKIETAQFDVSNDYILVNELLFSIFEKYSPKIKEKGLEFVLNMSLELEQSVLFTDKYKLNIVLNNILNNALKFTQKGSIEITYTYENDLYQFVIKDTGIGIKEEFVNKIFDRFFQADLSVSRNYEGTGLGLSICKEYVNLLGGKIWVESKLGIGSEFYFTVKNNK